MDDEGNVIPGRMVDMVVEGDGTVYIVSSPAASSRMGTTERCRNVSSISSSPMAACFR